MFIIILFGIKQLEKLWKKTFKNIYQMSFFVGHPVACVGFPTQVDFTCAQLRDI